MDRRRGRPPRSEVSNGLQTSVGEDSNSFEMLQGLVDQVINTGLDPSIFDVDLDVKFAKNVIEFTVGPEFMNMPIWARQAEQAVRLFCDYCPKCTDEEFFSDIPVNASVGTFRSKVVLLEDGVCPVCSKNRRDLFDRLPWELVSCLGQRSGKTALTGGIVVPYYVHRFLGFKNPARFYGLMSNSFFEITFVAVTAGQAKRTLWTAFKEAISQSPWFTDYISKVRDVERDRGFDKGTLFKLMDSFIWFGNKQLGCSYAAADMKTLRGSTRVVSAIDELAWFNASKEAVRANADETYTALSNSLRSVRSASDVLWDQGEYKTLPGMMINISSPSSQYDKMMSLLKEGEKDKRKVCFHLASWEASPLITRKSLETEEQNNPVNFWRDFGARPPVADSPFIESKQAIMDMQLPSKPIISWRPKFIRDKVDPDKNRYVGVDVMGSLADNRVRMVPRVIAVDCGEMQNSFAIGIYHLEPADGDGGNRFNVVTDAVIEAKPEKIQETGEIIPVHFPTMFGVVKSLCDRNKGLHIAAVLYDRWQSTSQIQELREMKVKAERYSPRDNDFKSLRNLVYAGNFKMPQWEHKEFTDLDITDVQQVRLAPYTHMAVQFATVREIGLKVIKPEVGDDDLFRTSVLAAWYMNENQKEFLVKVASNNSSQNQRTRVGSLALKSSSPGTYQGARSRTSLGVVRTKTQYGRR